MHDSFGDRTTMNGFVGAVQFLTRVPVSTAAAVPHERTLPWFGVVGLTVGVAVGAVAVGLGELVPVSVAAALAVTTGLLVTGAFHEDGLADVADAFGGGWSIEQRLEILKDSRHGTYGVAAMSASIVLRVVAAASIASSAALFAAFVAAHSLGRAAAVLALWSAPPASDSGLGVTATDARRLRPVLGGSLASCIVIGAITGWWLAPFLAAAAVGTLAVTTLARRKIGGLAGDVLGAVEQVVEILVLIVASGLALRWDIWWS